MSVDPAAATEAGAAADAAVGLAPGSSVAKYRLDRVLGTGGMGVVWAAFDPDLERPVAIKVLRVVDSVAALRTRLLREARAMARLKHPNILTVYEVGTDRNRDYIAMELIDGTDLDGWLETKPPRHEIFAALFAAGRGLAAAHDAGLIHRDLKPHNILRGRDGSVYVTDFGLARGQIDDDGEIVQAQIMTVSAAGIAVTAVASDSRPRGLDSVLDSPLTQTGVLIGTPAYMAPEQFAGRAPDPRSDQFAFCVTAWEALTGARPFAGKTLDELRAAASRGLSHGEALGDGGLPPRVRAVLARGLAPDPAQRWPDMYTLLRQLELASVPPPRSRLLRVPVFAAAGIAVVALGVGVAHLVRGGSSRAVGDCVSAEEAFGEAWSPEQREAALARRKAPGELAAATALLDSVRHDWLKLYETICAMPPSANRHERLACVLEVRDDIRELAGEVISEDGEISAGHVVAVNIALSMCSPH
jgi:eukaryotic-like serine/threonine-protein kinase